MRFLHNNALYAEMLPVYTQMLTSSSVVCAFPQMTFTTCVCPYADEHVMTATLIWCTLFTNSL